MNTNKSLAIILTVLVAAAKLLSCGGTDSPAGITIPPRLQCPTPANFVEGLSATVESEALFTDAQWASVISNVTLAFNTRFNLGNIFYLWHGLFSATFSMRQCGGLKSLR